MKLRFNILGFDICAITLDIEPTATPIVEATTVKGVKLLSKLWFAGMTK